MIRRLGLLAAAALVLGSPSISPSIGALSGTQLAAVAAPAVDFNGDGRADVAVGIPGHPTTGHTRAGSVGVLYGSSSGSATTAFFSQATASVPGAAETGDRFGAATAAGDFNGDGFTDLAVGSPGESLTGAFETGAVTVLYGGASGLTGTGSITWTQSHTGVPGGGGPQHGWGSSLGIGDFDGDGVDDLAVGAWSDTVLVGDSQAQAGSATVLYGSLTGGITTSGAQRWTQGRPGVSGAPEDDDEFGWSVAGADLDGDGADELLVGVPGELLSSVAGSSGVVQVLPGSASGLTATGSSVVTGTDVGAGGAFGRSIAVGALDGDIDPDVVIGAPSHVAGSVRNAGAVAVLHGDEGRSLGSPAVLTQATPGVPGTAESAAGFGAAVAIGDIDGDGRADLTVAAPTATVGTAEQAGEVVVLRQAAAGGFDAARAQLVHQDIAGAPGQAAAFDRFGLTLLLSDWTADGRSELWVSTPGDGSTTAGSVTRFPGTTSGVSGSGFLFDSTLFGFRLNKSDDTGAGLAG